MLGFLLIPKIRKDSELCRLKWKLETKVFFHASLIFLKRYIINLKDGCPNLSGTPSSLWQVLQWIKEAPSQAQTLNVTQKVGLHIDWPWLIGCQRGIHITAFFLFILHCSSITLSRLMFLICTGSFEKTFFCF